ncbi:MAG: hypothetical protein ACXVJ7_16010 [Acidimicrobiia bacterium]
MTLDFAPDLVVESAPIADPLSTQATATLQAALRRRGSPGTGARVELPRRAGGRTLVVAYVDPRDPWQVTSGAMSEVVASLRAADRCFQLAGVRFEPLEADLGTP